MTIGIVSGIPRLLKAVKTINESYDKVLKATGEGFNIFNVLKVGSGEVRLHSAFIAELLNTNGSHGQGDAFLKSFLKLFSHIRVNEEETISSVVHVEEYAGVLNMDDGTGGRLDIVVKFNNSIIVIENKINAGDQEKQLIRYHNYYPGSHLVYLTLDGKNPDEFSIKSGDTVLLRDIDYHTASYKVDIFNWLTDCRQKSVLHPLLRETISQYINLIKNLTGQTMSIEKEDSIVNVLTQSGDDFKAALEISGSLAKAKQKLLLQFGAQVKAKVSSKLTDVNIEVDPNFGARYGGIKFTQPGKVNWLNLSFAGNQSAPSPFVEMYNDRNANGKAEQPAKNVENLKFYSDKLDAKFRKWGNIENVSKAWHGDWVCRYNKLDSFHDPEFWAALANNDFTFAGEVADDMVELLAEMR